MPSFANKLIADARYLPLWSCICRDKFGFGRIPASSACVEGEFRIIKNIFLKNEITPMRADVFVSKHIKFLSGRMKLANAACYNEDLETSPQIIHQQEQIIEKITEENIESSNQSLIINIHTENDF